MSNLSLYTRAAVGRDPKDLSGVILALRFGCKSLGGWALGVIALRSGIRAPLLATVLLLGGAALWAWSVPGYGFLLAFRIRHSPQFTYYNKIQRLGNWQGQLLGGHEAPPAELLEQSDALLG